MCEHYIITSLIPHKRDNLPLAFHTNISPFNLFLSGIAVNCWLQGATEERGPGEDYDEGLPEEDLQKVSGSSGSRAEEAVPQRYRHTGLLMNN